MAFKLGVHSASVRSAVRASDCRPSLHGRLTPCASMGAVPDQTPTPSRRAAVLLGVSPFLFSAGAGRAYFVDIEDGKKAKETLDRMDQARDDKLDERRRFAFESLGKMSPDEHKQRAKVSFGRLQKDVKGYLDKSLYNRVSNELGLQLGNLRYDLEQLANSGDKSSRKQAQAQSKQAIKALERLDLYARLKKPSEANEAYSDAIQKLGNIVKSYG